MSEVSTPIPFHLSWLLGENSEAKSLCSRIAKGKENRCIKGRGEGLHFIHSELLDTQIKKIFIIIFI
jgi:hypothetical protein